MTTKLSNGKRAWLMGQVIQSFNNEEAYYESGWLYTWVDGATLQACEAYFSEEEDFNDLKRVYLKVFKRYYKDGIYRPEKEVIEFANETLKELQIKGKFVKSEEGLWEVKEVETESINEASEHSHLTTLIKELNAPLDFDGEKIESSFDFALQEKDGQLFLFDKNEEYTINYEEMLNALLSEVADEFGFDTSKGATDKIMPQIEEAVKKDFGDEAHIEWETSVRMTIVRPSNESITEENKADKVYVYQFPNSIEDFFTEFEALCEEHNITMLGRGYGMGQEEVDEPDYFVEGKLKDLKNLAESFEYELHPDYLTPADEFAYDDILIESKNMLREATNKQVDAQRQSLYAKTKGRSSKDWTKEELREDREISARSMMISILVYRAKTNFTDEEFDALFEREVKQHYLGEFLKPDSYGRPALSKERLKEIWDDMVKDFRQAEVGHAGEDSEGSSYNYARYKDESLKEDVKESKPFTAEEATAFAKEITQKLYDDGKLYDVWGEDGVIKAQIEWGDSKKDHIYFTSLVTDFFKQKGIKVSITSSIIEEDEIGIYSADYKILKIK